MDNIGYDLDELREMAIKKNEELNKIVSVKEGHIVINVAYEYNIELGRCDTHEKILGWVEHLCEKTWMTPEVLRRFIQVAVREHGIEITSP